MDAADGRLRKIVSPALDTPAIGAEERRADGCNAQFPNTVSFADEEMGYAARSRIEYMKFPSRLLQDGHNFQPQT
ncbi:hypothetical protein [Devosia oryzisoli]|uniref:hypothetical protein n=1 Tax=Devosia oryzisoli TaxID=2774138 RepID=UPI0017804458|nr:hypothetical protein [Devosia oryzisoli]